MTRQLDEFDWVYLKSNYKDKEILINVILNSSHPQKLLSFPAKHFTAQTGPEMSVSFKKRMKRWLKEFQQENPDHSANTPDSGLGKVIRLIQNLF